MKQPALTDLETRLRSEPKPVPPKDLHAQLMNTLTQVQRHPTVNRRPWRPLMAAAAAVILLAWHPVKQTLRVRHLNQLVKIGNQRLAGWLNQQALEGPETLQQENELLMADLHQGASFLFGELPFDAAVLAATQTYPEQGDQP